jgi:hypothetical protein
MKRLGQDTEYPENAREILSARFTNIEYKQKIIVLFDYVFRPLLFRDNMKLIGLDDYYSDSFLSSLIDDNLFLRDEIKTEIEFFIKNNFKERKMIGVHIRCTDNQLEYFSKWNKNIVVNKILDKLDEIYTKNKEYGIFLSTDNKIINDSIVKKYRNVVSLDKFYSEKEFQPIHLNEDCLEKEVMARHAVMDMYLLSYCDYLIYSSKSHFANISALLSKSERTNIVDVDPHPLRNK